MKNVELGGGENPRRKKDGYINVDVIENKLVDKQCDFEKDKLPFRSGSVEAIFSSHCLEHIENTKLFLNECHRILSKNGRAKFIVPYGLHPGSQKPVHKQCITECWFDFLRKENVERIYGYKRWNIDTMDLLKDKEDRIYEIRIVLTPIK